jgi:rhodanese-related sulfurtransferase
MSIRPITPNQARELLLQGAALIDIREADEHARERIPEARLVPLGTVGYSAFSGLGAEQVIFHCRSGARTKANARTLASAVKCDTYMIEGGLDAWKRAGLPVITDRKQPIEIMRQVQIASGSLVLLGVLLGATISPVFYALAGLVGAGLTLAGATGTCAMARLLRVMPWNRVSEA